MMTSDDSSTFDIDEDEDDEGVAWDKEYGIHSTQILSGFAVNAHISFFIKAIQC